MSNRLEYITEQKQYLGIGYILNKDSADLFNSYTTTILGSEFSTTVEQNMLKYIEAFHDEHIQVHQKGSDGKLYKFQRCHIDQIECYFCGDIKNRVNLSAVPRNKRVPIYKVHFQNLELTPLKDSNWI